MYRLLDQRRQHFWMFFNINIWCYITTKWFSYSKTNTNFPKCKFILEHCNASLPIFFSCLLHFNFIVDTTVLI